MTALNQIKRLSNDSIFYGLGNALQKFIGFLLFPIFTRVLSPEEFGSQDLVASAITILSFFLMLGLDSATARHYYDAETIEEKKEVLSTWLWFEFFISIPICTIFIIFAEPICAKIFNDLALAPFFRLGIASIPFTLISNVTFMALRLTFQSKTFSILTVVSVLAQALLSILLVPVLHMGITGVFLANLITSVFRASLGIITTHKQFGLPNPISTTAWLKPMLAYGFPLVPASLSLWILNYSNRYFLARLTTLSDIGLFSVGTRISIIVTLLVSAFQIAWGPFAFSLIKDEQLAKDTYAYESSTSVVPWLCFGSVAWGATYIVGMGTGIVKKSYHVTVSTILAAIVNTGLNFILIPRWGIIGAAASTMLSFIVALGYRYYSGQHYFYVYYEFRKIFVLTGTAIVVSFTGFWIDHTSIFWYPNILLYKIPLYLSFLLSLFIFRIVSRQEVNLVWNFFKAKLVGSTIINTFAKK
jgi:O-antigen/teichoic acid export membrane protein